VRFGLGLSAQHRPDAWLMNPHAALSTLERQQALFRDGRREAGQPPAAEVPLIS